MIRHHDVSQLTTAELERTKRELQANLGLITPHSPAHMPIQAQIQAIDASLPNAPRARRSPEAQPCLREPRLRRDQQGRLNADETYKAQFLQPRHPYRAIRVADRGSPRAVWVSPSSAFTHSDAHGGLPRAPLLASVGGRRPSRGGRGSTDWRCSARFRRGRADLKHAACDLAVRKALRYGKLFRCPPPQATRCRTSVTPTTRLAT